MDRRESQSSIKLARNSSANWVKSWPRLVELPLAVENMLSRVDQTRGSHGEERYRGRRICADVLGISSETKVAKPETTFDMRKLGKLASITGRQNGSGSGHAFSRRSTDESSVDSLWPNTAEPLAGWSRSTGTPRGATMTPPTLRPLLCRRTSL